MAKSLVTSKQIAQLIAVELMLPYSDIVSKKRMPYLSQARQISMYLIRKILNRRHIAICRVFNRDRSTVTHHIQKLIKLMETDTELRQKVERIEKRILQVFEKDLNNVSDPTLQV
jgi:chromosomal replication initiator protein